MANELALITDIIPKLGSIFKFY